MLQLSLLSKNCVPSLKGHAVIVADGAGDYRKLALKIRGKWYKEEDRKQELRHLSEDRHRM
jgi:N-acetyl-gamma-glutamylphosphate reductase